MVGTFVPFVQRKKLCDKRMQKHTTSQSCFLENQLVWLQDNSIWHCGEWGHLCEPGFCQLLGNDIEDKVDVSLNPEHFMLQEVLEHSPKCPPPSRPLICTKPLILNLPVSLCYLMVTIIEWLDPSVMSGWAFTHSLLSSPCFLGPPLSCEAP